jgi:hypothetical protein
MIITKKKEEKSTNKSLEASFEKSELKGNKVNSIC